MRLNLHSQDELTKSWAIWVNDTSLRSIQRFGQYIWNKYGMVGLSWPELFYETNQGKVWELLLKEIKQNNLESCNV